VKEKKEKSEFDLSKLEQKNGKYVLPLSKSIKHGEREITELHLEEPKAKHIRKMPTNPIMDDVLKACGKLAAEPDSVIDELSLKDCNNLAEFFGAFN
jgi:hypothetical protein